MSLFIFQAESISTAGSQQKLNFMTSGYHIANFFIEAGWFPAAERVLTTILELHVKSSPQDEKELTNDSSPKEVGLFLSSFSTKSTGVMVDVLIFHVKIKLLCSLTLYSRFNEANKLAQDLEEEIKRKQMDQTKHDFDVCQAYNQFAFLSAAQMQYKSAYKYSNLAVENITDFTSRLAVVDIFRMTSMVCLARRDLETANYLLKNALMICHDLFNLQNEDDLADISRFHPIYGDLLVFWAYYNHCIDCPKQSVMLYEKALRFRRCYFAGSPSEECTNLLVAVVHQELGKKDPNL